MRFMGAILAVGLLAGCAGTENPERVEGEVRAPEPPNASTPPETPGFVGRWAAEEAMCTEAAWVFTATGIETPGHVACTFDEVRESPEGYVIDAVCTAEGPPRPERIRLAYAQSANALLVEEGPFEPIGLVACGQ